MFKGYYKNETMNTRPEFCPCKLSIDTYSYLHLKMARALQVTAYLTRSALQSVTDPFALSGIDNANCGASCSMERSVGG